jgi:hypothetical protein
MLDSFEVATSLLHVSGGQPLPDEPAGYASLRAPRRAARGREKDVLFLCLALRGRDGVAPDVYGSLLDLAAGSFYASAGSVTAALRQAIKAVNEGLLNTNLAAAKSAASPGPVQGGLLAAALRGADFYAVQSGGGHLLVARPTGHERFPAANTRPLGLSNTVEALYFHTGVEEGDYVAFCQAPPPGWTDIALVGLGQLNTLAAVSDRLRDAAGGDVTVLIGRFEATGVSRSLATAAASARPDQAEPAPTRPHEPGRSGRGAGLAEFFRLRRTPAPDDDVPEPPAAEPASAQEPEAGPMPVVAWGGASTVAGSAAAAEGANPDAPIAVDWPPFLRRSRPTTDAAVAEPVAAVSQAVPAAAGAEEPSAARPKAVSAGRERARRGLRAMGRAIGVTLAEAIRAARALIGRTLPEGTMQHEGLFVVPTSVQIGIAVFMPLVVVAVSVWLYLENGRSEQYTLVLSEAQWEVVRGRAAPDPLAARPHWQSALDWLDEAERLRAGQAEVNVLRYEAQSRLDELDWVSRLDFQPLLATGLGRGAQIERMLLVGQDIFVLESNRNRVQRLAPTATGSYALDAAFSCAGSQTVRDVNVGQIVAIAAIPGTTVIGGDAVLPPGGAVIAAFDSLGALLYCAPGLDQPFASYLAAPEVGWLRPMALQMYADRMYVLDPGTSEIWQYQASGGAFSQSPIRYFANVSYDLSDVIDFSIAGGEVFLLRRDGRVTHCSRTGPGAPATCAEVAQFNDQRPGRSVGDRLEDAANPRALTYDAPPEPSLYLLDGASSSIYQLSLKLALVRQFKPRYPLPQPISAVALDTSKRFFIAAGDNVYFAARP